MEEKGKEKGKVKVESGWKEVVKAGRTGDEGTERPRRNDIR